MERLSRMKINDGVILITYPDSLGGNLKGLHRCMERYFGNVFTAFIYSPFSLLRGTGGLPRYDMTRWIRPLEHGKILRH